MKPYTKDGRIPLQKLYKKFVKFANINNFDLEYPVVQTYQNGNSVEMWPIMVMRTKNSGNGLWIISGIHGEEPAGPNALTNNLEVLAKLSKKIPMVILPLCNPLGYKFNSRYSLSHPDISVGDSEHLLLNSQTKNPRISKPVCIESQSIGEYILKNSKKIKPILSIDFHEDDKLNAPYIYSQGKKGSKDIVAKKIVSILRKENVKFIDEKTRFGERIIEGIVSSVNDGSIDELISSRKVFYKNKIISGPNAKSVIVFETSGKGLLKERIEFQSLIIRKLPELYRIASSQKI
jgi:hypothetical protein